ALPIQAVRLAVIDHAARPPVAKPANSEEGSPPAPRERPDERCPRRASPGGSPEPPAQAEAARPSGAAAGLGCVSAGATGRVAPLFCQKLESRGHKRLGRACPDQNRRRV